MALVLLFLPMVSDHGIINRIGRRFSPFGTNKAKKTLCQIIVESICSYGVETWELKRYQKSRLLFLEMDYLRSSRVSRLDYIRNDHIRDIMKLDLTILDTIKSKRLIWYGHFQRMPENRWPKKI